jgi:hypothetical protein
MWRRRDRAHLVTISAALCGGLVLIGIGVLEVLNPPRIPGGYAPKGSGGFLVSGLIFTGIAIVELVRRVRRGPQPPGRHTRE